MHLSWMHLNEDENIYEDEKGNALHVLGGVPQTI